MELELKGKQGLVTGASKGIGAGIAEALAAEGCDLVLVARSTDALTAVADRLRDRYSVRIRSITLDLSIEEEVQKLRDVEDVDILVNNAGAIPRGTLASLSNMQIRAGWDLKLFSYITLSRIFYAKMKERGGGVILNNIGMSAESFDPAYIAGSTANAGLVAFTRTLGARSLDDNIRVVGISPGPVATERITLLLRERDTDPNSSSVLSSFPLGRCASVREIADAFVFLASPRSMYTSGIVMTVDGGLSARRGL
jgi:NAD(P)-dependent dehydrogenase (short-subunit alcohol dehydrogenase family)